MEKEIWKDIQGYEGLYQVSNLGNIKNIKTDKILKPYLNGKNSKYLRITLLKNKKTEKFYVHRLMAITFLNLNKKSKLQVDHIDNNSFNNNLDNLQILTQKENIKKQMINMKENIDKYENNKIKYMIVGTCK